MAGLGQQIVNIFMAIGLVAVCTAIVGLPLALINRSDKAQRKRRAIADYRGRLSRLLKARYGPKDRYSPAQVKTMMKEWGYSTPYDCYGLAMYCNCVDFMAYHHAIGQVCNYEAMRSEISHILFGADTTFTITDLLDTNVREFNEAMEVTTAIRLGTKLMDSVATTAATSEVGLMGATVVIHSELSS